MQPSLSFFDENALYRERQSTWMSSSDLMVVRSPSSSRSGCRTPPCRVQAATLGLRTNLSWVNTLEMKSLVINWKKKPHQQLGGGQEGWLLQRCKKRGAWGARSCYFSTSCANFWAAYAKNMLKYALLILWKKGRSCKFLRFLHLCQRILDGVKISTASCSYLILCRNQPYSVSTMQNLQRTRQCLDLTKLVFKV